MDQESKQLNYGTAHLRGFMYEDTVCIDPIGNRCAKKMQFLALYEAKGLGADIDGILGLSNHNDDSKSNMNFIK